MDVYIAACQWFVPLGLEKVVQWTLQHDHFNENLSLYDSSVDWWLQKSFSQACLWKLTVTCLEPLTPGWRFVRCHAWDSAADSADSRQLVSVQFSGHYCKQACVLRDESKEVPSDGSVNTLVAAFHICSNFMCKSILSKLEFCTAQRHLSASIIRASCWR